MIIIGIVGGFIVGGLCCLAIELGVRKLLHARQIAQIAERHPNGYSVEVDCRGCGQFNRVPQDRLRDRPKCGRCKAKLMPKNRVVLCRITPMESNMRLEISKVWEDEDQLWSTLADHVVLKTKEEKERKNPDLRVVN